MPGASFTVQRILVDGDFAAVHYRGKLAADDKGAAVVEIFRFDKGRIVEHWDMLQGVPETSRNAHSMF
ncbi:nuclear transport factor 2 family protein, partial [Pseudoalteromonas sp. NZS100_1]|nr:nuclear transport factor 2 family protein [Pseudoalteromonas sp. NZS100_1]